MQGVILTGGRGARLSPLTDYVPKPLLPINGTPALQLIIESLAAAGIDELVIYVDYMKDDIITFVESNDGFGSNAVFVDGTKYDNSVRRGMAIGVERVSEYVDGPFLLAACDTVFPVDYIRALTEFHHEYGCDVSLSVSDLGDRSLLVGRSCVDMDDDQDINRIIEKPTLEEVSSTWVSTPMYVLDPLIFDYISETEPSINGEYELQPAIQLMIDDGRAVKGCVNKEWNDIGAWVMMNTTRDLLRLNFPYIRDMLNPE